MKVIGMTTNAFWKGEWKVSGLVEDDGKELKAALYIRGGQIRDRSCSCDQGNSYKGLCEHCEALYAYYKEHAAQEGAMPTATSLQARTMIREYTNREVAKIKSEGEEKKIILVPELTIGRQELTLKFKLGHDRFYVIKDLAAFAKAVESGNFVEYGKNLSFHHGRDAFAAECRPLLDFVLELVNSYCEHYAQFQKGFYGTLPVLHSLDLSRSNRDRFFYIVMGQVLYVQDYRGNQGKITVVGKNPEIRVGIRKTRGGGIRVSIDKSMVSFTGERHLYLSDASAIFQCDLNCTSTLSVFMEQMTTVFGASCEVVVSRNDIPLFYERVLKKIAVYSVIDSDIDLDSYKPEELKARFEFDTRGTDELTMKPTLSYGDFSFHPVEDEKLPRTVCRDVPGEFRISQLITKYFKYKVSDTDHVVIRNDEDALYLLLTQGMEEFMAAGEVYLSESFRQFKVLPPPKVSIGVNSAGSWLELTVDTGGMSGAELNRLLSEYRQKKKYYRLRNGEFLTLDDNGLMTVAKLVESIGTDKTDLQQMKFKLPRYRALYLDSILKEGAGISFYRDALFKSVVRGMKSVEDSDFDVPALFDGILRGYQKIGYRWLRTLDHYGFGGILADDMGLGKTVQVIALLYDEFLQNPGQPSLIICPASLVYNWENEIRTFAPQLRVLTIVGTMQERKDLLLTLQEYDVLITSYDLLKRDISFYQEKQFRFQIIDEAQCIKNAATQSAKAVKKVNAHAKFALTGTPIENRLSELWSIFDYLMPGFLFTYARFRKDYESPIVKDQDREMLTELHRMIGPFILRRLKKDVLKELPDKLETVVYSKFEQEQKDLYTAYAYQLKKRLEGEGDGTYATEKLQVLSELTRLRQLCCDPKLCFSDYTGGSAKLETCMDLVFHGVEGGHKILLFSQFTSMLEIVKGRLEKDGLRCYLLTGSSSKEERLHMVNAFHEDDVPVFLISLKAGGTGLNLTAADIVIHYDPWWNVAAQNQATDRAHRIGQEKQVAVFKLITKGTIEENIIKLQDSKKDLAEQVITEGTISLSSLTREDLLGLLD